MADEIKMLHPDHKTRDDGGVYYAADEVEAMNLTARGYQRADDKAPEKGAKSAPSSRGGSSSESSTTSSSS